MVRVRLAIALACGAGLLSACTVGPDYRAPDAEALHVPAAWSGASPAAATDLAAWWRVLGDATLDALEDEAIVGSRDIAIARARLRESRARQQLARAGFFPSVSASLGASRSRTDAASQSFFDAGFDASWEPDVFGGQRRAVEAADADLEAATQDLHAAQVSLAAEVALEYVNVRSLQARLAIARGNLAAQTETLQLTQWRTQAGLTSSLDVEQARTSVEQTRAQLPALETSLAQSRNRLSVLTGVAPGTLDERLAAAAPVPPIPASLAIGIPADTLRQRPDLRAAERRLAAETARVGEAEAARYPALALTGSIGMESLTFAGLGDSGALVARAAAQLAATIFDAGRLRARVQIQDAVQERALHAYESAVLSALEDVENALAQWRHAAERRAALADAAEAARNASLLAQHRYAAGITDFQTVLDTQRTLLAAQDGLEATGADQALAFIRLYKALGGGWNAGAGTNS